MKNRILCAILALIMVIGMIPVTAMNASAASMKTSDDAIKFIKQFESYSRYCYIDGDRHSIGYGTECEGRHNNCNGKADCNCNHKMEETAASAALAKELAPIERAINSLGLRLQQRQFDALVSFSYNNGTAWIYGSGIWKSAVTTGKTGNDFLYAIGLWSYDGAGFSAGLMNRRLAEANMYLNGIYSKNPPANYTYVLFDANGGTLTNDQDSGSYKMQAFIKGGNVAIKASAKKDDHIFMGWYTRQTGGERVTALTSAQAGKTLYARWQSLNSPGATPVNYTLSTSDLASLTVYDAVNGNVWTAQANATAGETVKIIYKQIDEQGIRWGRIENSGWVKIANDAGTEDDDNNTSSGTGVKITVTNAYINIRPEPVATGNVLGKVYYGEQYDLLEVKTSHGALWGKITKDNKTGWIALMYTNYDSVKNDVQETPSTDKVIATGTVSLKNANSYLNIRTTPDATNNSNLTGDVLRNGDKVNIYEVTLVNGVSWGRTADGWISLSFVKDLTEVTPGTEPEEEEQPAGETPIATGTVISTTALNVRKVPTTIGNVAIDSLAYGTKVDIYEIRTVKIGVDHDWGRIGTDRWVCLDYVQYTMLDEDDKDNTTDSETDTDNSGSTGTASALFTGTISSSSATLNVRSEPSTGDVVGKIPTGTKVSITELALGGNTSGNEWGKVSYTDEDGKTIEGWIYLGNVALDPVNYTVVSKTLKVRPQPGTDPSNEAVDKLSQGTIVEISQIEMLSATSLWGYSKKYNGWMCITSNYMQRTTAPVVDTEDDSTESEDENTNAGGSTTTTPVAGFTGAGVVNGAQLNIRSGPGMGYPSSNKLMPGSEIKIYEYVVVDGAAWGRTDYGWVCLSYVLITAFDTTGAGQKGTVAGTYTGVNVRTSASTNSVALTKIMANTRIEILEIKNVNGSNWGRTSMGWVSMDYVLLDTSVDGDIDDIINGGATGGNTGSTGNESTGNNTTGGTTTTTPTGPSYGAKIIAATDMYKTAGSSVTVGNALAANQNVSVYEIKADENGVIWARVGEGWVKAENVKLNSINQDYTVVAKTLNVRTNSDASSKSNIVAKLEKGDVVKVTDLVISNGAAVWGKATYKNSENVTISGYICLTDKYVAVGNLSVEDETPETTPPTTTPETTPPTTPTTPPANVGGVLYTGTVNIWDNTADKLNVRDVAGGGKVVEKLSPGVKVNIVEITVINNMPWGKCGAGWICLTYVDLVPVAGAIDARVVLYANSVNVHEGAGHHYGTCGTIAKGNVVDILEVSGQWVRTAQGWIEARFLAP